MLWRRAHVAAAVALGETRRALFPAQDLSKTCLSSGKDDNLGISKSTTWHLYVDEDFSGNRLGMGMGETQPGPGGGGGGGSRKSRNGLV